VEVGKHGSMEAWEQGNLGAGKLGSMEAGKLGSRDLAIYDLRIWGDKLTGLTTVY